LANTKINGSALSLPVGLPAGFPMAFFASSGDEKPLYRAELRTLSSAVGDALGHATDRETKAHLKAVRDQIDHILDPKYSPTSGGAAEIRIFGIDAMRWSGVPFVDMGAENSEQMTNCWPDYEIRP
jgi:hypothetical protein